jgi:hypothetical protein
MAFRTALFLVPAALLLAQAPSPAPPPEVEQALRANVTEFFQDFVDQKYRQAINLVAEDTQDQYFASPKAELKAFTIDTIGFSNDFTKADVKLTVKQVWKLKAEGFMQDQIVDAPMATTWKIENEKWVWYQAPPKPDSWVTPMGPSAGFGKPGGATLLPKKLDDAALASEAARILQHVSSLDKDQVSLALDHPSSAKVVFHNGVTGSVSVSVVGLPRSLPGFSAKLDKEDLNQGQDATLEISYDPLDGQQSPPAALEIYVEVAPFSQRFPIRIDFGTPPKQ